MLKILVIEDDADVRDAVRRALAKGRPESDEAPRLDGEGPRSPEDQD